MTQMIRLLTVRGAAGFKNFDETRQVDLYWVGLSSTK